MRVEKADLGQLIPLAEGAFGNVFRVPDYRLPGDQAELAYKEFISNHAVQARSADAVVSFREMLSPAGRDDLDRYTVWPRALVEDKGTVTGLLMPLIPDEFFCDREDPDTSNTRRLPLELQWLIATKQQRHLARIDLPDIELPDRLALLAQLAYILARLHEHGWVFGDLSFKNAVFALNPLRMMLLDCDGAAALTDFDRRQTLTPLWEPPEFSWSDSAQRPAQFDQQDTLTDVYKLGLAILRCLSPGKGAASARSVARIAGVLDAEGANLISRAISADRSSRPTARELYAYLYKTIPHPQRAALPPVDSLRAWVRPLAGVRSDAPSAEDLLSTASDADTLAELIAAIETAAPLAVALIGDWGSGKSSVMLQIQRRIDVLAEMSRNDPRQSMFSASVRQVRFNAWDYSDDHVWVGIAEHLFRALAADTGVLGSPADFDAMRAERIRLRTLLVEREAEEEHLAEELQAVDETAAPRGYLIGLSSPARAVRVMALALAELARDVRCSLKILLGWVVLGVAATGVWLLWGPLIGATASALAALLSPAVAVGQRLRGWHRAGSRFVDAQRNRLDARQRRLRQEIAQVKQQLAVADAAARLSAFLADRAGDSAYSKHRGLLGQVRGDLAQLSADLAEAHRQWAADGTVGPPPLERLVLYIDDLDRCPPRKVVEVLEAIHLMLALDLFVVVVAVDARWVIRSLEYHYRELFSHPTRPVGEPSDSSAGDDMASPADYLDKIFQIPFALTPPTPEAIASYLRSLLPLPAAPDALPPPTAGDDGTAYGGNGSGLPSLEQAGPGHVRSGDSVAAPLLVPVPTSPPSPLDLVIPDLRPLGLQLMVHEVEFMMRLSAILPTPRAAKKLTNLYRLVRIRIPETQLADFTGSPSKGPYQIAQILLAMLVSSPEAAHQIFQQIMDEPPDSDILKILTAIPDAYPRMQECVRLSRQVAALVEQIPAETGVREYQRWCPVIARYSFHTRTLTNVVPQNPPRQLDAPPLIDRRQR
jgi:KAP-like P-loop domain-containing protein